MGLLINKTMDGEFLTGPKDLRKRKIRFKYKEDIEPQEALSDSNPPTVRQGILWKSILQIKK